jgi:hypothetical protein
MAEESIAVRLTGLIAAGIPHFLPIFLIFAITYLSVRALRGYTDELTGKTGGHTLEPELLVPPQDRPPIDTGQKHL